MRHLLLTAAALLWGCNASLAQVSTMGTTAMGLSSTPGTILSSPLNGPSPFSAITQPGAPDTTLAPVPLASDPSTPGTVVTCATPSGANRLANADGAGYFDVGSGKRDRDDATDLGRANGTVRCSRVHGGELERAHFALSAQPASSFLSTIPGSNVPAPPPPAIPALPAPIAAPSVPPASIDTDLHSHGGEHSHDDAVDHDHVIDRDDVGVPARNHSHARRRQHDGHHFAGVAARQCFDHGVQLDAGWSTDQRRSFAAVDAASSGKPSARHDRTRGRRPRRHQHRSQHGAESGHGRDADAEHVGLRRERDDESRRRPA